MGLMNECYRGILGRWVDCEVPHPGEEILVLIPSKARRVCRARLAAPSACAGEAGVASLFKLDRHHASLRLPFPLLWRCCLRLGRKSLEGRHLRKCLGVISHSTPTRGWRSRMRPDGKSELHSCPHAQQAGEMLWGAVRFCLGLWTADNFIATVPAASWLFVILACLFFKCFVACWNKLKLYSTHPVKLFVILNVKSCVFYIFYQLGVYLFFYAEFVFL